MLEYHDMPAGVSPRASALIDRPDGAYTGLANRAQTNLFLRLEIFAWTMVLMVPLVATGSLQRSLLAHFRAAQPIPSFWGSLGRSDQLFVLLAAILAGLGVFLWRTSLANRLCALLLVFALTCAADVMIARSYYAIEGSAVMIRLILPWRPMIRFPLASSTVIARDCRHVAGRNSHEELVFEVRYGPKADDTIDLGSAVGSGGAASWLAAMNDYRTGVLTIPPESSEGTPLNEYCFSVISRDLDEADTAALRRLIG